MAITLDTVYDNRDGKVTVASHDDQTGQSFVNIIGVPPNDDGSPGDPASSDSQTYYQNYVQSTLPPEPQLVYATAEATRLLRSDPTTQAEVS